MFNDLMYACSQSPIHRHGFVIVGPDSVLIPRYSNYLGMYQILSSWEYLGCDWHWQ